MNAPVKRATTLLPHELPETFAMDCEGTCLEPKVRDGTKLLFSRDAAYVPGDLVCLFIRPEFVRPGEHQFLVKKLVFAPARGYWRNPASYEGSDIKPTVIVDMLNPLRRIYIKPEALYGIYKCLGPVPSTMRAVPVSNEELKFKAAASMGEHTVTRHSALALTGSSLTAALAGAVTVDAVASPEQPERRVAKVDRLSKELAKAMDEWCRDIGCGEFDPWKAHIYPASYTRYPITFESLDDGRHADDPLLDAVLAFKAGDDKFNATRGLTDEERDALAENTYSPPMRILDNWEGAARTRAGAIAALRIALYEAEQYSCSPMICTMLAAALAYLDPTDAVTL